MKYVVNVQVPVSVRLAKDNQPLVKRLATQRGPHSITGVINEALRIGLPVMDRKAIQARWGTEKTQPGMHLKKKLRD